MSVAETTTIMAGAVSFPEAAVEQSDLSTNSTAVTHDIINQSDSLEITVSNNSEKDLQETKPGQTVEQEGKDYYNVDNTPQQTITQEVGPGHVSVENDAQGNLIPKFVQPQIQMQEASQIETDSIAVQVSPIPRVSSHLSPAEYHSPEDTDTQGGASRKTKRRGSAWTDDQTFFLMEIWARHTDASGNEEYSITNAPIYRIISRSMNELGYIDKTSDQCKCRIHTLKRAYKITKAEIDAGAQNITFCRHYDKLKIIHGDDPSMTPKQLAEVLAEKRRAKGHAAILSEPKPKKLKPSPNHRLRRALTADSASQQTSPPKQTYKPAAQTLAVPQVQVPPLPDVSSLWNHATLKFPFAVTPSVQFPSATPTENQLVSPVNTQSVSYQNTAANETSPNSSYDVNHNTFVVVKKEKQEDGYPSYQPSIPKANETTVSQTKEEIERMRLDLEIKKIEMERNRLEMEERQRREDRDHQYRMMQLLLVGLGHNPTLGSPGPETEEAHQPELSRALEGGLVPGGTQSANEKGLSFSEI